MSAEMAETLTFSSWVGFNLLTLFFWIRGVLKVSRSDLLIAVLLLIISCYALMAVTTSCEVFNSIGINFLVFGIVSHWLGRRVDDEKTAIKKNSLRAIGTACFVLGILLQLHA
jgi:hypothetical protein